MRLKRVDFSETDLSDKENSTKMQPESDEEMTQAESQLDEDMTERREDSGEEEDERVDGQEEEDEEDEETLEEKQEIRVVRQKYRDLLGETEEDQLSKTESADKILARLRKANDLFSKGTTAT
jgi:hypothetical protein